MLYLWSERSVPQATSLMYTLNQRFNGLPGDLQEASKASELHRKQGLRGVGKGLESLASIPTCYHFKASKLSYGVFE